MRTILPFLAFVFTFAGCTQGPKPRPEEPERSPNPPPARPRPRTRIGQCTTLRPAWIGQGSFTDPSDPKLLCWEGVTHQRPSLEDAKAAAEAAARLGAGAYMGSRVKSLFEREFQAKVTQSQAVVEEVIRDATTQAVDSWLVGARSTESWWEQFDDGTWDAWVLLQVSEQNLVA